MKNLILAALMLVSSTSYADKIDELQKIVSLQMAQIQQLQNSVHPVGTIIQSLLDEKTFLARNGSSWRLMKDALNIEGTELCSIYRSVDPAASCILANTNGVFLRNAGGNAAALGAVQDSAVQLPNLSAKLDHNHANVQFRVYAAATSNTWEAAGRTVPTPGGLLGGTAIYGATAPQDIPFAGNGPVTRTDGLDPKETRPRNLTVNFFVRVNR